MESRYRLALDMGTATGWALAVDNRIVNSGTVLFEKRPGDLEGERLVAFYLWLTKHWNKVNEVHYEKVIGFSGHTDTNLFNKLYAMLEFWSAQVRIPIIGINPSTLKKQFTGHGRAEKKDMCGMAMRLGWPNGVSGTERFHDEADAVAILVVALRERQMEAIFDYGR